MSAQAIESKKVIVSEITDKLKNAQSAVVVEYRGLTVEEVTELRRSLRAEDVEFKVYKNKMVQRATEELGFGEINTHLVGPNAIAFGTTDACSTCKSISKIC